MRRSRYGELLRQRTFVGLAAAMLVDGSASWAFNTVFAVIVFDRTHSVGWISLALAARWVPSLLLGPFAGLIGDRLDRVRVLSTSAAASAVVMGVLSVLVATGAPVVVLLVVSALQATCATPYEPALAGLIPDLVPERLLAAANGLQEVLRNLAVVAGPAVGAVFLLVGAPAGAVLVNAVSYLVPLLVALRIGTRSTGRVPGAPTAGVLHELREGVTALREQSAALVLVIACVIDSAIMALITVMTVPISVRVGTGADGYAYLSIAGALGSVLAAGLAGRLAARRALAGVIAGSLILQAVPLLVLRLLPNPAAAFVLLMISGAAMLVVDILAITALQRDLPREYMSRVFGIFDTLLMGSLVIVAVVGGLLTQHLGIDVMLVVVGAGVPVLVLLGTPLLVAADRRAAATAVTLEPVVALLEQLDLFEGADRPTLERIAIAAERVVLPAGQVVLREGDAADDLWLLAEGELGVAAAGVGELPPVLAPGYVGEIGLLHERPRTATVTTVASCTMYRVPGQQFLAAVTENTASSSLVLISGVRVARTPAPTTG